MKVWPVTHTADDFLNGTRWRVLVAGARLFGWTPIQGGHQGWSRALNVGDVLTCAGTAWTMGDGVPALMWTGENGEWLAQDCTFHPYKGGMWGGLVLADGFLEPVNVLDEQAS